MPTRCDVCDENEAKLKITITDMRAKELAYTHICINCFVLLKGGITEGKPVLRFE